MDRKSIITASALSVSFLALFAAFQGFVLDDAYIIFRYSAHLASGMGLVWNPGEHPVEGYTSFLWVVLNAGAMLAHLDPVVFSKLFSALSGVALIWLIVRAGQGGNVFKDVIFAGAIALSPAFAFNAASGLETALDALLLALTALLSIYALERPTKRLMIAMQAAAFASMLTRPDSAAFVIGVEAGMAVVLAAGGRRRELRDLVLLALPFAFAGAGYMAWRVHYFGHLFPNSFYVKVEGGGYLNLMARLYATSFMKSVLVPYLALLAFLLWSGFDRARIVRALPALAGCLLFGIYLLGITPIQGLLWRYILPAFAPALLAANYCFNDESSGGGRVKAGWAWALAAAGFAAWALHVLPVAMDLADSRTQHDRVLAGKALHGVPGTMLTSESGALPYYSGWRSVDTLGLTSEEVALHGMSKAYLERLNPDLIVTVVFKGRYYIPESADKSDKRTADARLINEYMIENGFEAAAAIRKSGTDYHFYFVRRSSPDFHEIVKRLTNIKGVEYGDLGEQMVEKRIPVYRGQ